MNQRSKLLSLADTLVNGDRNRQYGDPQSDFHRTSALWEAYLNGTRERQLADVAEDGRLDPGEMPVFIDAHDVAALMILLKLSRLSWSPDKEDTWADIAGYAACGWDCVAPQEDEYAMAAMEGINIVAEEACWACAQEMEDDISSDGDAAVEAVLALVRDLLDRDRAR